MATPPLFEQLGEIMRSERVRAKCAEVADKIADRAKSNVNDAEDAAEIKRSDGTRPGTHAKGGAQRPYSRISVPVTFEYGGPNTTRQRILGRAAAEWIKE